MNSRTLQQPPNLHSCHYANSNAIAQPPPFKKMAPMPSHHPHMTSAPPPLQISQRGYGTQVVLKAGPVPAAKSSIMPPNVCAAQRIPNLTMSYIAPNPKVDEMRVKFEHDGQLAASIAPPTPPATPAPTSSNWDAEQRNKLVSPFVLRRDIVSTSTVKNSTFKGLLEYWKVHYDYSLNVASVLSTAETMKKLSTKVIYLNQLFISLNLLLA